MNFNLKGFDLLNSHFSGLFETDFTADLVLFFEMVEKEEGSRKKEEIRGI
jgi:hypothetical protein